MRLVSKWVTDAQDRAVARFLSQPEDFFYGEGLDGLNVGPGVVAFGEAFEDPNVWLMWVAGGLHYVRDGIDQGELGSGGGGAATFLELLDTPGSYAGDGGAFVRVTAGADALEFVEVAFRVPEPINIGDMLYSGDGTQWQVRAIGLEGEVLTVGDIGAGDLGPVWAESAVDWDDINGKPVEFPPSAHGPSHELGGSDELVIDWTQLDNIGTFLDLSDTPASYGDPGFSVVVNGTGDGLVFIDLDPGGGGALPPGDNPNDTLRWSGGVWTPSDMVQESLSQLGFFGNGIVSQPDGVSAIDALETLGLAVNLLPELESFLDLTDTPATYLGQGGLVVAVTAGEDGLEFSAVAGVDQFINLIDTPAAYVGWAGAVPIVTAGEDGLEFAPLTGGGASEKDYRWTTSIAGDPGLGNVGVNNADPTLATVVHISEEDDSGNSVAVWKYLRDGDHFWVVDTNSPDIHEYLVTGPAVDFGTYEEIPVTHLSTVGGFNNNEKCTCAALFFGANTFIELLDTPPDYVGQAGLYSRVTSGETGLEFDAVSYDDLTDVPATFPPSAHTHPFTEITGTIDDAQVPLSAVSQHQADLDIEWDQLLGVPGLFPPEDHTHPFTEITGQLDDTQVTEANVTQYEAALGIDWSQLSSIPATFPPDPHTHTVSEITDFPVLVTAFPDLSDTPGVLGDPGQVVVVNGIGDALDFATYTPPAVGFNYIYTPPGTGDPEAGELEFNHPDPTLATECAVNEIDAGGNFVGAYFPFIQEDDWFTLVGATAAGGGSFTAAGQAVFDSGVWTIPIQGSVNDEGLTLGLQYRASAQRPLSGIVEWDDIVGKPAEFPPSPHTHDTSDIITGILGFERGGTGLGAAGDLGNVLRSTGVAWESAPLDFTDLSGVAANAQIPVGAVTQHQAALAIDWAQLVGTQPPPVAHDQAFTTITGQNADAQVALSNVVQHQAGLSIGWAQLTGVPATFPPSAHAASHGAGGADPVTLPVISTAGEYELRITSQGFSCTPLGANDQRRWGGAGRIYHGVHEGGLSGTSQYEAGSWPNAQSGWLRIYSSSGGNGFRVTFGNGGQESVQTSGFADEEEGVAETPTDYLMQEVFRLQDQVATLYATLASQPIPIIVPVVPDPYAAQSARTRKPPNGTAIP